MQVKSDGIIANIPYPSSGAQVDQEEASGWIAQTDMFAGRYPQYATLLKGIGELWKRKLETIKVAQVSAPVTSTGSSAQPKSTDVPSPLSEIAVLQTKSGQTFKKVTITRFDGDKAIINYADGIGRVSLSDFGDLSALPQDVKLAIEKATAVVNESKNKAEAERIAKEEKERTAKEVEEQRLAKLEQEGKSTSVESRSNNCDKAAEDKIDAYMASIDRKYGKDVESGFAQMDKDAEGGNVEALFLMGSSCSDNAQDEDKYAKDMRSQVMNVAVDMLKKAADQGHTPSQYRLANIYLLRPFDWGIPYDKAEGIKWLQKAASQGSERAQRELREYGFTQDSSKSSSATRTSQETENDEDSLIDSQAFTDCVEHYYGSTARGMTAAKLNKLPMVLRLAQSGNADAQYVAFIHTTIGIGFKRDPSQGFLWLKKSAAGGNAEAQFTLALFHLAGANSGVKNDPAAARRWAARAAAQGNKDAQSIVQDLDNKERSEDAPRTAQPRMPTDESSASPAQRNKTTVNSGEAISSYRREQLRKLNSPEYRKHLIEEATRSARGNPATALMSEKSIENMVDKSIADTNRMAQLMTDEEIQRQGGF